MGAVDEVMVAIEVKKGLPVDQRPTWAEIDLDRLVGNYRSVRDHLPAGVDLMAVVKADAYGHGALQVARTLQSQGVKALESLCLKRL